METPVLLLVVGFIAIDQYVNYRDGIAIPVNEVAAGREPDLATLTG